MATKKQNEMKVTIWTENMRIDFGGTISACVIQSFGSIMASKTRTAANNREMALRLMTEEHEKMTAEGL